MSNPSYSDSIWGPDCSKSFADAALARSKGTGSKKSLVSTTEDIVSDNDSDGSDFENERG